jgi:hypothetical protein
MCSFNQGKDNLRFAIYDFEFANPKEFAVLGLQSAISNRQSKIKEGG